MDSAALPTDTGLYWTRGRDGEWYPALVVWWSGRLHAYTRDGTRHRLEDLAAFVGEWRGPLAPPVDP